MTIGIDCIALPPNFSGAAYYIINLVRSLLQQERQMSYQIYCKKIHIKLFSGYLRSEDEIIPVEIENRFQQLYFYEFTLHKLLIRNKTDIFLATHYITPKKNSNFKSISIFHDLGFILHPHYYPRIKQLYFTRQIPKFIKRADKIVTVSKSTLNDLTRHFPASKTKAECIYPGTDHIINETIKPEQSGKNSPFILAVNSFEKRKNIPLILNIFSILKNKFKIPHKLYLVGQENNHSSHLKRLIGRLELNKSVKIFSNIDSESLNTFYKTAHLFISTSQYEGFGFTPFEAIKSGLPAFLFKNSVCKELFKEHDYVIPNSDPEFWAELIHSEMNKGFPNALNDGSFKELTWSNTSRSFLDLFNGM